VRQSRGGPQEMEAVNLYAQYLAETQRGAQAAQMLQDFLAGGTNLEPLEKANVLSSLAGIARTNGDSKAADEYQREVQTLVPMPEPEPSVDGPDLAEELQKAEAATNQHLWNDAYAAALHAVEAAQDGDAGLLVQRVTQIAQSLAANQEPAKGETLFRRLFAMAQASAAAGLSAFIDVTRNYAVFLNSQPDRWGEAPAAIARYRNALIEANGPDSASLAEPLRLKLTLARARSQWDQAESAGGDLLEQVPAGHGAVVQESEQGPLGGVELGRGVRWC